jgi:hypothetical protein
MANLNLTPEVKDVLSRATINGNNLHLPPEQLDRKLYEAVNKALNNLGGKWVTKARAHVFASDPTPKLQQALGTGIAVDEKKLYQSFYTPADLAAKLAQKAEVSGRTVLEPSAGHGAIAKACRDAGAAEVSCIEINSEAATHLWKLGFETTEADFLSLDPSLFFDRVVMNPPFTRDQDIAHVAHALKWLRPGGILVAVMLDKQSRPDFLKLARELDNCEIEELPRGTFRESGTDIPTLILRGEAS